ncbi:hypothetical protein [Thermococcus gorgonarius]|uniref:Uncharacterized protein n=1 Tax=Thermococcus gorgonarius TaxID=71997 RepID=A0A2Z2MA59_THEGO|nr:hypothetical protein [Thermococcus gorgonarius]ASJ00784.1 hypothetical protein A3K92_04445 [Thermococcus gorgonarius]
MRKLLPFLVVLMLSELAGASIVLRVPDNGTVTYPWVIAGIGTDGREGFIIVTPFNVTSNGKPPSPGALVLDIGENGSLRWVKSARGASFYPSPEIQYAIANGSVVLVGRSDFGNPTDLWVIRLDHDGELLWSKDYNLDIGSGWITFVDDVSMAGNETIIATHVEYYSSGTYSSRPLLIVLDGNGRVLWARQYWLIHGPRELYSAAAGKLEDGYYLILHDNHGEYYYLNLGQNGEIKDAFRFQTRLKNSRLKNFFVKSATSAGKTLYFLGGSSNGTVLGMILNGEVLWSRLYTLTPKGTCRRPREENASLVSVATYSTEPSDSLVFSRGYLFFQPAVSREFNLTCDGLNRVYAVIKTDGMGNVLTKFAAVENTTKFGVFMNPKGLAINGDSFIALWSLSYTNGSFVRFRDIVLISEFGKSPQGSLKAYPIEVTTNLAGVTLVHDGEFESRVVAFTTADLPLKVEKAGMPPFLAVETLKDKHEEKICGPGVVVLVALFTPLVLASVKNL